MVATSQRDFHRQPPYQRSYDPRAQIATFTQSVPLSVITESTQIPSGDRKTPPRTSDFWHETPRFGHLITALCGRTLKWTLSAFNGLTGF
jgi:hypothetical protein